MRSVAHQPCLAARGEEERVRAEARASAEDTIKQQQQKKTAQGCLGCFGVILLVAIVYALIPESPERQAERQISNARGNVTILCERGVRQQLRAPGTADFPFGPAVTVTGTNTYRITSYVDSQNAFGATLRSNFVCDVTGTGDELSGYRITNLTLTEN